MKKTIFVTIIILAMLISLLPMSSAFAKREVGFVNVEVRNLTNTPISVVITDSMGLYSHLYAFEPGIWNISIQKGHYSYLASTSCGMVSGTANFDMSKKLAFHCKPGVESSVYRAPLFCKFRTGSFNAKPFCAA